MSALGWLRSVRICAASVALGVCAKAQLELRHDAPFAGSMLNLEVRGAAPGAQVELFVSPRPARVATPWGLLEIELASATTVASGVADSSGWFGATVALAAADVEAPRHFQALVTPPSATPAYSPAAHLRALGARAYAGYGGFAPGGPFEWDGGLAIVSLARDEWIATVEYGPLVGVPEQRGGARPVFRSDFARGVVAPDAHELVVFDPFFGRVLERLPTNGASTVVFSDRAAEHVYVLDGVAGGASATAQLHRLDLRATGIDSTLPLAGEPLTTAWAVDAERGVAYVASGPSPSTPTSLRRIALDTLTDLGPLVIGPAGAAVNSLARSDDLVLANLSNGTFVRVRETASGPEVSISAAVSSSSMIEVLPTSGLIAQWLHYPTLPGGILWLERLAGSTASLGIGVLQFGGLIDMVESPRGLWAVSANSGLVSGGYTLGEYDLATRTWTSWNASIYVNTPAAIARFDDASGARVCIATDGVFGNVIYERPRLLVLGPSPGEELAIPIGPTPTSLLVVPAR